MTITPPSLHTSRRGGLRLALRIARRDALQHKARSILIVVLVALPIIALSGIATVVTSNQPTVQEQLRDTMGANQAKLSVVGGPNPKLVQLPTSPEDLRTGPDTFVGDSGTPAVALPSAYLPAGTRILSLRSVSVIATTASGVGGLNALQGQPWDIGFAGRFQVMSGARPANDSQVMATPAALVRLGLEVGDELKITQPRVATFTIVGTMRDLGQPNSSQELFARPGAFDNISLFAGIQSTSFYLPKLVVPWGAVQELNKQGISVTSRSVFLDPPPTSPADETAVGDQARQVVVNSLVLLPLLGFTLFEVALLAGAAFMVGTKQQQRGLATLASVGGDRRMLSRVVSYAGIVLGLAGGILGSAVGIAGAAIFMQVTADGDVSRYPGFHVNPALAAGIVIFAVLAGWISALVPARVASRVDVVSALRGAVRPAKPSRKTPVIGVIVAVLGALVTVGGVTVALVARGLPPEQQVGLAQLAATLIVIGPILLQVAALVIAPTVLRTVALVLSRLGTGPRLASRDAARNASRSVPAIGAIMSTIFVASFFMTYVAAAQAQETQDWTYSAPIGTAQVEVLPAELTEAQVRDRTATFATSLQTILGHTGAVTLASTVSPAETDAQTSTYPVALVNPATRCTQAYGPKSASNPGSVTITDDNCEAPQNLVYPNVGRQVSIGTPHAIEVATGVALSPRSKATLAAGGIVAFSPGYVVDDRVSLAWLTSDQINKHRTVTSAPSGARTVSLVGTAQTLPHQVSLQLAMLPATARSIDLPNLPRTILLHTGSMWTDEQGDALNASAQAIFKVPDPASIYYEGGPPTTAGSWAWVLLAVCSIIALGAASVALGLARSDGRRNEAVLGSLGAPPHLRRSFGFWSGIVLTGIGAIGGVILGTIPAIAVAQSFIAPNGVPAAPFSLPWLQLGVTAFALPLVLAAASWLAAGSGRVRYNERAPIG